VKEPSKEPVGKLRRATKAGKSNNSPSEGKDFWEQSKMGKKKSLTVEEKIDPGVKKKSATWKPHSDEIRGMDEIQGGRECKR